MPGEAKLTEKMKKLVQGKVKGLTHKQAYLQAGYSKNMNDRSIFVSVDQTLKKPHVQEYYKKLEEKARKKAEDESIASALEIKKFLTSVMRGEETEPTLTKNGELVYLEVKHKDRLKASELLGKTQGVFVEQKEITISNAGSRLNSILMQMNDEEDNLDD